MENLELENDLEMNNELEENQNGFFNSTVGKIINSALNIGIEYLLPDFLEDEVINVKDAFLKEGFQEGVNELLKSVTDIGKSAIGIITGDFENISQIKKAVEKGGLIDGVSQLIDKTLNTLKDKNIINKETYNLIKTGKKGILDNISDKLEDLYKEQNSNVTKINNYIDKWKEAFKNEKFSTMETNYKKIQDLLDKTMPFKDILSETKKIENLHNLIKNNDKSFELSETEKELANNLI